MAARNNLFVVEDGVYDCFYVVSLGLEFSLAEKKYRNLMLKEKISFGSFEPFDPSTEARVDGLQGRKSKIVWFRDRKPKASVVAHEALHVTIDTLKKSGMSLSDNTQEAYCYHLEWLTREILKRL